MRSDNIDFTRRRLASLKLCQGYVLLKCRAEGEPGLDAAKLCEEKNKAAEQKICNTTMLKTKKAAPTSITYDMLLKTQGKIDLRNESGRPMKVKVVGEVSEK